MKRRMVTAWGRTQTITQWHDEVGEELGIARDTIRKRINNQWDPERALSTPNQGRERIITVDGVSKNLVQWSRCGGVAAETIRDRLEYGYSPDEAVSLPADGKRLEAQKKRLRRVAALFRAGNTRAAQIARRLGVHRKTIENDLSRLGLNHHDAVVRIRRARVAELMAHKSNRKIAEILGCSHSTVHLDVHAIIEDPDCAIVDRPGYCACGKKATHREPVTVGTGSTEYLELCEEHYQQYMEVENTDTADIPRTLPRSRF